MSEPAKQMQELAKGLLSLSEPVTTGVLVPFFDMKSLSAFTSICRRYRDDYADKKTAAQMLHCVLNPTKDNQKQFLELMSIPKRDKNGKPLYLIENDGEEVYFNEARVRKIKTIRYNTNVLEAILRTKNFHLAKILFNCIPEHEKTEKLKRYISEIKSQEIWGMPELQIAYNNFLDPWRTLYDAEKRDELKRLGGRLGQVLKEQLPWFSIYLFFDFEVTLSKIKTGEADYRIAPDCRCILWSMPLHVQLPDGRCGFWMPSPELDLDSLGPDSIYALYKGLNGRAMLVKGDSILHWSSHPRDDSESFAKQSKVLSAELDKTIKLHNLDEPRPDSSTKPAF